ncbi:four-carbon acid sugar kinase family protein [Propionivibrio soli]|uniref:four-carbon acid sugar kinase family protein n=1 Tax=Propionivibrio soli TaxID=2976531 RepID=UPI0021E768CC|nr:four-carbon acid sugar kinase family protein [Propionivibrio soli]
MTQVRILADDLTGALDTAAAFEGSVPVFLDRPPVDEVENHEVAVVATPTRDVEPASLPGFLEPVADWFAAGRVALKKVDSLLRGNTFEEMGWLYRRAAFDHAVFAPAFPGQGRITADGHQWIVHSGEPPQPVAVPFRDEFARLGITSNPRVEESPELWIANASTDAELDDVVQRGESLSGRVMWIGSAGLGNALARRHGLVAANEATSELPRGSGPTVMISASFQAVFREQWAALRACRNPGAIAEAADPDQMVSAISQVRSGAAEAWFDLSPRQRIDVRRATENLDANTKRLVGELPKPGRLIVVGGDTLLGLCRASGATGLLTHPSPRPGWGCAQVIGGVWDGLPCYSRSGAFGTRDDLVALYAALGHATSC